MEMADLPPTRNLRHKLGLVKTNKQQLEPLVWFFIQLYFFLDFPRTQKHPRHGTHGLKVPGQGWVDKTDLLFSGSC